MSVKKTIGGHHMIVLGYLTLEPGNCLGYQIFNFRDVKNWRNEMRIEYVYPKSKTILPQPPVHVKLYFNPEEWEEIRDSIHFKHNAVVFLFSFFFAKLF